MASLKGILSPDINNSLHELDNQATTNQPVPDVGWADYAKASLSDAYLRNPTYSLLGKAVGYGSPDYSQDQLQTLYPDVPPEHWKGGANAFQAELLYDRYKHEEEKKQLGDLVSGVSDPNSGWAQSFAADTLGGVMSIGAGLADPLTLATFATAGAGVAAAGIKVSKIAPAFMAAVAGSRILEPVAQEVAVNLLAETAVNYPLNKTVLNDYDKEDRGLKDAVTNAVGSAVAFSALKYGGKKVFGPLFHTGGEFVDKMREDSFTKTKDKVNSHLNSETANNAAFMDAATHTATAPIGEPPSSVSERMSKRAFDKGNIAEFDSSRAPYYGVYDEASGRADYAGERFGDNHMFVSSPEAAQGMFDMYAKDGNVYSIYGHKGDLNLLDLEAAQANHFPDVLDQVESEVGKGIWSKLDDNATLADVFRKVNDIAEHNGASGQDITAMFDNINKKLLGEGYQGTTHFEQQGNTRHTVMSVFDGAMNADHLEQLQKGTSKIPTIPAADENFNTRTDSDIISLDGKHTPITEPLPYDHFYDADQEFIKEMSKYNDPEYLKQVQETVTKNYSNTEIEKLVDDNIKVIEDDLKMTMNLQKVFHGSAHDFESFSMEKVNTGEGAQVYGHGLYFAQDKNIAEFYKNTVGQKHGTDGHLYEALIPKDTLFADWEGYIGEQPKEISSKLLELARNENNIPEAQRADHKQILQMMGKDGDAQYLGSLKVKELYKNMAEALGSDKAASKAFKDAGIQGIVYADANSRGGGNKVTGNMVVFDESAIQMTGKDGASFVTDYTQQLKEKIDLVKEELKNNPPARESEFVKAMENCLRKNA